MGIHSRLLWLVLLLSVGACSPQKKAAEQAYAQVQTAVDPVSADLEKYAPDEFEKLSALMAQMRQKLNSEDYEAVLALQPQTMSQLIVTSGATAKRKLAQNKQINSDWKVLATEVPNLMGALADRLDVLRAAKTLPPGLTAANLAQVEAQLPSLRAGWAAVTGMMSNGSHDAAIAKAKELRERCLQLGAQLGVKLGG